MIYLDNAATTFPKPVSVLKAVELGITRYGGNPGRGGHFYSMQAAKQVYNVREKASRLFNCDVENVIFTLNCTMSLNMAIKGFVKQGEHVIISSLEHNSVIRPIHKALKYSVATVYDDINNTINSFKSLIKSDTKAIICTAASNVTGVLLPIKEIGELCSEKGLIFIVDGAQAGGIIPIDMVKNNITALAIAAHKGLYAVGCGMLLINGVKPDSIIEGGTGSSSLELTQPDFLPDMLESGTVNVASIMSIGAGIDFILSKDIYKYEIMLCKYLEAELSKLSYIKIYGNKNKAAIVAFNVNSENSNDVVAYLNESGYALRGGLHCSPLAHTHYDTLEQGMVRFSPSIFTKIASVEGFITKIKAKYKD